MLLLCGGTGMLGGQVAELLAHHGVAFQALVRTGSDASHLTSLGGQVVAGDLTDKDSLRTALAGVQTVLTTATAIGRRLGGDTKTSIAAVDVRGNMNLIDAAEQAGVEKFVFVSLAGLCEELAPVPFAAAKLKIERRLRSSPMQAIIVRPDKFQEHWLSPTVGIDPARRRAVIFGRGQTPEAYVAIDDVAAACVQLACNRTGSAPDRIVEFGGPERLTGLEVVRAFEEAFGLEIRRLHVPRPVLAAGARALRHIRPEVASVLGMTSYFDHHPGEWDSTPLENMGIQPRTVSDYISELAQTSHQ